MVQEWEVRNERRNEELYNHVVEVWEGLRRTYIPQRLTASMPERLRNVIEKEGGWTKY